MKIGIIAIILNTILPGTGYLLIGERKPLAIFLSISTAYEIIRNMVILLTPNSTELLHLSPFWSIPGLIVVIGMAVDVYYLIKNRQKSTRSA
jgi:hypothetical protein